MPRARDLICKNSICPAFREVPSMTADEVLHCDCGGVLELAAYPIASVWVGEMTSKYLDKTKEGGHRKSAGHWGWENGSRPGIGAKPVWLSSWQDQKDFCKRNGLARPQDQPANFQVGPDGKTPLNTCGLPGTEI